MALTLQERLGKSSLKLLFPLTGLFLFVLPIPHTLIVREAALFISVLILVLLFQRERSSLFETLASLKVQAVIFALFLGWILFLAFFVSADRGWALNEIKTQWGMGSLALVLGAGMATLARRGLLSLRTLMTVMYGALGVHVLALNVSGAIGVMEKLESVKPFPGLTALTAGVGGFTIGPIDGSLLASLFFVVVASETVYRALFKRRLVPVPRSLLVVSFVLVAGASVFTGLRNIVEMPILVAGVIFILFFLGREARKKVVYSLVALMPLAIGAVFLFYRSDARWAQLSETLDLVMKEKEPARILAFSSSYDFPRLQNRKRVNVSNFIRFTKYRVALRVVREYPLGIGFGRNAFGHYLKDRYKSGVGLNSDSSLLDMAVGAGVPGVAFFGALIFSILAMSFRSFTKSRDYYALVLYLIIICFGARMVFDSVLRDHLLEIFLFVTGMLATRVSVVGTGPVLMLKEGKCPYGEVARGEQKMKAV